MAKLLPRFSWRKSFSSYSLHAILFSVFLLISTTALRSQSVSFGQTGLQGENVTNPTSLQFGPNGKLYVAQQDGTIWEMVIERDEAAPGSGSYTVTNQNAITIIKNETPNHNDDGTINSDNVRQITGIMVTGTAENPILYVTSSDYRIGGGPDLGDDRNLDTNSGVLSRLTWDGSNWDKVDLVRGLPRCEENHSTNGISEFERNGRNYLLIQQGGNTNMGAPSNNFAGAPETFLSGALLIIDLTQLEEMETAAGGPYLDPRTGNTPFVYDLPTLNDPERMDITNSHPSFPYSATHPLYNATIDLGDPFGGNNGLNQAFTEVGGPVQIFSPGYRNAYDVVITQGGLIYTSDNGPNATWGGPPVIYDNSNTVKGDNSNTTYEPALGDYVTNQFNLTSGITHGDQLHYIGTINDPNGTYYGGHPAPVRAFPSRAGIIKYVYQGGNWINDGAYSLSDLLDGTSGYFKSSFSLADFPDDPRQGDYTTNEISNPDLNILDIVGSSTNGICEFTASNFNGAMQGDLLTASWSGKINRYKLGAGGTTLVSKNNSFLSGFGSQPLDLIAQGDNAIFPGTIWAVTFGANNITIFEPADFVSCLLPGDPDYDASLDYDNDGYTNEDEVLNGTDLCSGGSRPNDFDEDGVSDLLDDDDDNDGIPDIQDAFAIDAANGLTTNLPVQFPFWNNDPGTGFFGLGFTGLMLDPDFSTDYLNQYVEENLSFGGAAGKATVDVVSPGSALTSQNDQDYGFQFGVNVDENSNPFTIQVGIDTPFNGTLPESGQEYGVFIGNGDQDNYLKLVISEGQNANDGLAGFNLLLEDNGTIINTQKFDVAGILEASDMILYLGVNPSLGEVQAYYSIDGGLSIESLGTAVTLPGTFLNTADAKGLAVGLISTSGQAPSFTATWDFINITEDQPGVLQANTTSLDFGTLQINSAQNNLSLDLTNLGGATAPKIAVTELNFSGTDALLFDTNASLPLEIGPGETKIIPVNILPDSEPRTVSASLEVVHSGTNSPLDFPLTAEFVEVLNTTVIRVNTGGGQENYESKVFEADQFFTGGKVYTNNQADVPTLFKSERSASPPQFAYNFPVPDGDYQVNLYFAEIYWGATGGGTGGIGSRIFDVTIEDNLVLDDLDIFAEVGAESVLVKPFNVVVADGQLNIAFNAASAVGGNDQPKISAIEILSTQNKIPNPQISSSVTSGPAPLFVDFNGSGSSDDDGIIAYSWDFGDGSVSEQINPSNIFTTPGLYTVSLTVTDTRGAVNTTSVEIEVTDGNNNDFSLRVNAGGSSVNYAGKTYLNDQYFTNGTSFQNTNATVPDLFITERTSPLDFQYNFPVANGDYLVSLYFAEIYWGAPGGKEGGVGSRVFDVEMEGATILDDFDIYAEAGAEVPINRSFVATVNDGILDLVFTSDPSKGGVDQPKVSAIEIIGVDGGNFPVLTLLDIPDRTSVVDEVIDFGVSASGGDPSENITYAISGQPNGVDIEPTNGQIFGVIESSALQGGPQGNGVHNVTVTVSQPSSNTVEKQFEWIVTPANSSWTLKPQVENYTARHECGFVQAGTKFYLLGGRESATTMEVYDYQTNIWSALQTVAPKDFNHIQPVLYDGLIWIVGGFQTNNYPNEVSLDHVWIFNPATESWYQGPAIPEGRKRGSAGTVVYNNKIYLIGGNTQGHDGGYVPYFDVFDPATGKWTSLPDAPRARDHFQAVVINGKLYAAAGRLTGGEGGVFGPAIPEVDVYDFGSGTWTTLSQEKNIPTPRASAASVAYNGKVYVMGGEAESSAITQAFKITEIYDPIIGSWSTGPEMNFGRHGTQAIVSGQGIHITGGSPKRGGGNQKNMEYLNIDAPQGNPSNASELQVTEIVSFNPGETKIVAFNITGGNVGVWLNSIQTIGANAGEFNVVSSDVSNRLLSSGNTYTITVKHTGSLDEVVVPLEISFNDGESAIINLVIGNPPIGDAVTSFSLVNADTNNDLFTINDGDLIDVNQIVGVGLNIRANTNPSQVGSVVFSLQGPISVNKKESVAPYAIFGDVSGNYNPGALPEGNYVLSATPYSESKGNGTPGATLLINFSIGQPSDDIPPTALATADIVAGGVPLSVTFTGSGSSPGANAIAAYEWDFGDGNSSSEIDPTHIFEQSGVFTVTLLVTDTEGLSDTATLEITVNDPVNNGPIAIATSDITSGEVPLTVNFDGSGSTQGDNPIVSYAWDFGDGNTSGIAEPVHEYTAPGVYTAVLTVVDELGLESTDEIEITVNDIVPEGDAVISFTLINADTDADLLILSEGIIVDATAVNGTGLNIRANTNPLQVGSVVLQLTGPVGNLRTESVAPYALFGDSGGNYFGQALPEGNYTITATPFSASGGGGTPGTPLTINFSIGDPVIVVGPTAIATSNLQSGEAPLEILFNGSGSLEGDNPIINYAWDFGDGGSSEQPDPTYNYNTPGNYTATLTVTDDQGLQDSDQLIISVSGPVITGPTAIAVSDVTSGEAPFEINFNGSGSVQGDNPITTYSWDFGDGGTSDLADPTYTYLTPGSFLAVLTVTDDQGLQATDEINITVTPPAPEADQVVSFTLINAATDNDLFDITEGIIIDLNSIGTPSLNIRANTSPAVVGSVIMQLSGPVSNSRTESVAPYALFGDSSGNYFNGSLTPGDYSLTATPYTAGGGGGTAGTPLVINFSVVNTQTKSGTIAPDSSLGEETVLSEEVLLYPNPTNYTLNISGLSSTDISQEARFYMHDIKGALLKTFTPNGVESADGYALPVDDLQQGVYLLSLESNGRVLLRKRFVVMKQ
ncbi:PKD domain-containing protein [Robertkochia marina]|uniref:PKD domain-containing protein n=1 Tax=Robertkochia marina TaxID=1227945 RepID=A0A4S3M1R2_9FLAO|nr:PKD domain-containing protein [Robertkochia marina]THD67499.1 PKD domain-containing protein [Robertkochia marina]TRZ44634.1 PKD domain-containing protein [Robertkochia marina]